LTRNQPEKIIRHTNRGGRRVPRKGIITLWSCTWMSRVLLVYWWYVLLQLCYSTIKLHGATKNTTISIIIAVETWKPGSCLKRYLQAEWSKKC